jgi:hypothetical protein
MHAELQPLSYLRHSVTNEYEIDARALIMNAMVI